MGLQLGARTGKYGKEGQVNALPGANLPLATLGTFILWMGWFGFNGGSVLKLGDAASANSVAMVFLNTNAAAAGGAVAARVPRQGWVRGTVLRVGEAAASGWSVGLYLPDLGQETTLPASVLRMLPASALRLPGLALELALSGVLPADAGGWTHRCASELG